MIDASKRTLSLTRAFLVSSAISGGLGFQHVSAAESHQGSASPGDDARCEALSHLSITQGKITGASVISGRYTPESELADNLRGAKSAPIDDLPPTCRVTIVIPGQINGEVWLPTTNWNNRYQAVGSGGYAGFISYDTLAAGVKSGYATSSTDTGHRGGPRDGRFVMQDDETKSSLITDFAHRSVHLMAVSAKEIIAAFYSAAPKYSYWNGCSTGGRQGLMQAQRYPTDFNGVLAGAPAINWDRFIPAELWPQVVMQEELGGAISSDRLNALNQALIAEYDEADGIKDGIISSPESISVSDAVLAKAGLSKGEIVAIRKIWLGPTGANGESLWYGLEPGAPFSGLAGAEPFPITHDFLKLWVNRDPALDWKKLGYAGFEKYFKESVKTYRPILGTDDPNLSEFKASGGKLIMWHGWSDQLIFPKGTIEYYRALQNMMGSESVNAFARLYMAPGVEHCRGGAGPDRLNGLEALVKWVEKDESPTQLMAEKRVGNDVSMTRPLCSYPQQAVYKGTGSVNSVDNFECKPPKA